MVSTKKNPVISVGLVTWNSAQDLSACLDGLDRQDLPVELVVVDNASTDDSVGLINDRMPETMIIRNDSNEGFCKGHNRAIRNAHGKYYLALNPDVHLNAGYLPALIAEMEQDARVGITCGKLLLSEFSGPQRIDTTGLFIDRKRRQFLRGHGEVDSGQYDQVSEVFGADGAAPLYRREMLEDIQVNGEYFDEAFVSHKEDVDLSWRARLLGWRCIYTPHAVGYHRRSFRPGRRQPMSSEIKLDAVKNRYLLLIKNELPEGWRRDWLQIMSYDLLIMAYSLLFERSSLRAIGRVKRLLPRARAWRAEIMRRKVIDSKEMLQWFR